jgi:anti-sigma regulatory factor (Ser/Thr protein kinase)
METGANSGLTGTQGRSVVDKSVESVDFWRGVRVKSFFEEGAAAPLPAEMPGLSAQPPQTGALGRIAVYDSLAAAPRVEDVVAADPQSFIETLAARVYGLAHEQGGTIPYTLIREIVENFIHAHFSEVVVTVLDRGDTIRFSDQGPGISDKEKAFLPGYSTATREMKQVIRGVGSGLPIVKECLSFSDGVIDVADNLGSGTVVTLRVDRRDRQAVEPAEAAPSEPDEPMGVRLSVRQKQVLSLAMELAAVGPTSVANELGVAVSTAYRDLAFLEEIGLIATDGAGKRALTDEGVAFLDQMFRQ